MSQPGAYPELTTGVEMIETHISWVFLTDRFAYKLKKPVRFEFLDFSTLERRREACRQEISLNKRLAPDVYLELVPIVRDSRGRVSLGGTGSPIDWVVKMKRLAADRALDQLIRSDCLNPRHVDELADCLSRFYMRLPPVTIRTDAYCRQFNQHIRANQIELSHAAHGLDAATVECVHGAQLRFLALCKERLVDRVRDGRVVEGHGDLRPEHVYLTPEPRILDCIEFNAEFRTLDVTDELAFLGMECDRLRANWVGNRILEYYEQASGDKPGRSIVDFYKCYRACVRAKVTALRAKQVAGQKNALEREVASDYLRWAATYAAQLGRPLLLVIRGTSGTGKSTLAASVADEWGASLLQTDAVRRKLFAVAGSAPGRDDGYGAGRYSPENRRRVYDEMFQLAGEKLRHGITVIVDGTFLSRDLRARAMELAKEQNAEVLIVRCECSEQEAWERIRDRGDSASEIRPDYLARQRAQDEPDDPSWPVCTVATTDGLVASRKVIDDHLKSKLGLCAR